MDYLIKLLHDVAVKLPEAVVMYLILHNSYAAFKLVRRVGETEYDTLIRRHVKSGHMSRFHACTVCPTPGSHQHRLAQSVASVEG